MTIRVEKKRAEQTAQTNTNEYVYYCMYMYITGVVNALACNVHISLSEVENYSQYFLKWRPSIILRG